MMMRKLLLLVLGFVFLIMACKEEAPVSASLDQKLLPPAQEIIPERPSEIEILDLTDEIDLFVVIAGAYSAPSGAQKKADALKKAGFTNADIVQRPGSKLYSAIVERFDNEASARAFADDIATNQEIKSYVYKLDD